MSCGAIFIVPSVYIVITSVWLGRFLSAKCVDYRKNISVSFNQELLLRHAQVRYMLPPHVAGTAEIN